MIFCDIKRKTRTDTKKNEDKNQQPKNETTRFPKAVPYTKDYRYNLNKRE